MKKSLTITALTLVSALLGACSTAKPQPEPETHPAPIVEQASTPADLGAASTGSGL